MPCTAEQGNMWLKPMSKQHAPVRVDAQHGSCPAESELTALNYDCLLRLTKCLKSNKNVHVYVKFNETNEL